MPLKPEFIHEEDSVEGSDLQMIVQLVKHQMDVAAQVEQMEEALGELKAKFKQLSEELIPDKMAELGLKSLTLDDGSNVMIEKFYAAHISEEHRSEAFNWLRKNKHDGIIKTEVIVVCKRGEQERAKEAAKALRTAHIPFEKKDSVHHATLRAFVREQMEDGQKIPTELFGVFVGNKTKIKTP